jgi:superfamily II DNA/RNA helicase
MASETETMQIAEANEVILGKMMNDLRKGLRKVLLRPDAFRRTAGSERGGDDDAFNLLLKTTADPNISSWQRTVTYADMLATNSGSLRREIKEHSRRQSLWRGVFMHSGIAAVMNGDTDPERRRNLCAAFNSPLMPDILICTSIGSEGIDLHLNCADIIHHDLPWNPAKLEQRTGRIDRVGSLSERADPALGLKMNIGIPFLASDYDEFNYRVLVTRAQKQDVLLGAPEFAVSSIEEEKIDEKNDQTKIMEIQPEQEVGQDDEGRLGVLPESLLEYLKINLAVKL